MTCEFENDYDEYWYLRWYNGSKHITEIYECHDEGSDRVCRDRTGRCAGKLVLNVHQLYINTTTVADEGIYTCEVVFEDYSAYLTVNGENYA